MLAKVVLFNDPLWGQGKGYFHILKIFERCRQLEFFHIKAHVLCKGSADDAVPMEFWCIQVCHAHRCAWFTVYQIPPRSNWDLMRGFFLWMIINDRVAISEKNLHYMCMHNIVVHHHKHSGHAFLTHFIVPFSLSSKVPAKCCLPDLGSCWIMLKCFVTWNCLSSDWGNHKADIIFVVDRHFGIFHEGAWSVYRAEGSLFLQGKYVQCLLLNSWLHLWPHVCRGEHCSLIGAAASHSCVMDGTGMMTSVLFRVMHWWRCFVCFMAHLVVGLHVCMMVGKSIMQGIVIIGESLIALCSSAFTCSCHASATLCSSRMGIGFDKPSILCPRYFINCLPLVVWLANVIAWVSLSVSA